MSGKKKSSKPGNSNQSGSKPPATTPIRARAGGSAAESRRAQRVVAERRAHRNKLLLKLGGAAGLAVLAVVAVIAINNARNEGTTSALVIPAPDAIEVMTEGRTKGDPNAPVKIVEWADYQCPACGVFARDFAPQLVEEYVATGQVFLEYRDMAFLGDESTEAAKAAVCAEEQDKFWDFHSILYYNQSEQKNSGAYSRSRLNEMASTVGLDEDAFGSCMADDATADTVQSMYNEATAQGIDSTPTFIINGTRVSGANYSAIREAIEAALAGQ